MPLKGGHGQGFGGILGLASQWALKDVCSPVAHFEDPGGSATAMSFPSGAVFVLEQDRERGERAYGPGFFSGEGAMGQGWKGAGGRTQRPAPLPCLHRRQRRRGCSWTRQSAADEAERGSSVSRQAHSEKYKGARRRQAGAPRRTRAMRSVADHMRRAVLGHCQRVRDAAAQLLQQ